MFFIIVVALEFCLWPLLSLGFNQSVIYLFRLQLINRLHFFKPVKKAKPFSLPYKHFRLLPSCQLFGRVNARMLRI